MTNIRSNVPGISNRAFNNALKAKIRDPSRSVRLLTFLTVHEKEIFVFTALGDVAFENWLDIHSHRYDTGDYELTSQERYIDYTIRIALNKKV